MMDKNSLKIFDEEKSMEKAVYVPASTLESEETNENEAIILKKKERRSSNKSLKDKKKINHKVFILSF
jgi:hypothetical protein